MRGTSRVLACTLLVTMVAGGPAGADPDRSPGGVLSAAELPEQVQNGVIVDLPDGDRFKVWHSGDLRTVWGQRYDAATATWGGRAVVLRKHDLECGDVDARSSGGAVAVIAQCDRGTYHPDQAPVASHAIYSSDTVAWTASELDGEAHEEPGISPDGRAAVWPLHEGYVTWTASEGFAHRTIDAEGQEYTVTATIADDGTVSMLYGTSRGTPGCSTLVVLTRSGDASPIVQELHLDHACADVALTNVDALTVRFGDPSDPEGIRTVTRPDTGSPWAVTGVAPRAAPGLVRHRGRGTVPTSFFHSRGLPLVAIGSADGVRFDTQAYDAAAQRWEPVVRVRPGRTCRWGDNRTWADSLGVLAARLHCSSGHQVLVSTDAHRWHALPMSGYPLGVSADRRQVSVTNASRTYVVSRERGVVRLPVGATRRCDVVLPASPDTAIRLTTSSGANGWPTVLQESRGNRWRRTSARVPRANAGRDRCGRSEVQLYDWVPVIELVGQRRREPYSVIRDRDGWKVRAAYP